MPKLVFINLAVTDLPRSIAFYEAVGATKNPRFSDETAACMVFSETIHVMLLTHAMWRQFTPKAIPDARSTCAVMISLSEESREAVDRRIADAVAAGGAPDPSPPDEYDFMYGRSFEDPDGHMFGVMWMDLAAGESTTAGTEIAA